MGGGDSRKILWLMAELCKKKPAEEVLKHSFASLSSVSFSLLQ